MSRKWDIWASDRDRASNLQFLNKCTLFRVSAHAARALSTILSRCGNYISALVFHCVCACSFTGLDVFFPRFARCACIGVCTRERTSLIYVCIRAPVCIFYGCICAAWLTCFLRIYACSGAVRVRTLHAIGIHEKVHELYPATTPLDEEIEIHSVTLACPSLPSWVTSATKHLQCYSLYCASVETVRISSWYYCDSFFKRYSVESTMKKFQNKRSLVLLKLLNVSTLTPWQILWFFFIISRHLITDF